MEAMGRPPSTNVNKLAQHLFVSPQRIRELESEGVISRTNGAFDIDECRRRVLEHLRQRRPKSQADEAWRSERARELAIRNAIRLRDLIDLDEAMDSLEKVVGVMLTEVHSLPARCTRDLAMRKVIDREVVALRQRVSDKYHALAKELKEGPKKGRRQ
jgi:hypothetical protein